MGKICLNVGCGADYKADFINIDASDKLFKVDKIINLGSESLQDHFQSDSVDFILANDIIEHHFHWEAVTILQDFFSILKPGGQCEIRVPDCEKIIRSWRFNIEKKLTLLFGGQDIPQGGPPEMESSRTSYPHLFCHKYGWTKDRMKRELLRIGFISLTVKSSGTNFVATATK